MQAKFKLNQKVIFGDYDRQATVIAIEETKLKQPGYQYFYTIKSLSLVFKKYECELRAL